MAPWRAVPPLPPYAFVDAQPEQPKFGQTLYVVSREIAALVVRRGPRREHTVSKVSYRRTEKLLFLGYQEIVHHCPYGTIPIRCNYTEDSP